MRKFIQFTLVSTIIPLILLALLSGTLKFKLLDSNYWLSNLEKNQVYSELTINLKKTAEDQIDKQGGNKRDVQFLLDLITEANVKDIIDKNLINFLGYANGIYPDLMVYIPQSKIPKDFLPKEFLGSSDTIPFTTLLSKLNIQGINHSQIQYISIIGKANSYFFILDSAVSLLLLIILVISIKKGSRFTPLAIAFVLSSLSVLGLALLGRNISSPNEIYNLLFHSLLSPIMQIWFIVAFVFGVIGVGFYFIRRPAPKIPSSVS